MIQQVFQNLEIRLLVTISIRTKATVFPMEVLISAGSKPLIFMVMKTVLNASDQVLVHEPAWLSYEEHAKMCNAKIKFIPYQEKNSKFSKVFY